MVWPLLIGGVLLAYVGSTLLYDGKTPLVRVCGTLVTVVAGVLLSFGTGVPGALGYVQLDKDACALYAYSIERDVWDCVPAEQGG